MKKKENAIVWTVTAKAELLKLVTLINGHLRSPKLYQFNLLIDYVNTLFPKAPLIKHSTDCSPFSDNYWLTGLIDADGGFYIRSTEGFIHPQRSRQTKKRIALRFRIEQRQSHKITNESFEPLMKNIADFLTVKLSTTKHSGCDYWCVEVASFRRMQIVIDYLNVYPLLTTKRHDYDDFCKAFCLMRENQHLTPEGAETILRLKNGMNRKRTLFNWDPLN